MHLGDCLAQSGHSTHACKVPREGIGACVSMVRDIAQTGDLIWQEKGISGLPRGGLGSGEWEGLQAVRAPRGGSPHTTTQLSLSGQTASFLLEASGSTVPTAQIPGPCARRGAARQRGK